MDTSTPQEFVVVLTVEPSGGYVAECPAIPGCISQGETHEEAIVNIREAIKVCLVNQANEGWVVRPVEVTTMVVTVAGSV